MKQSDFETRQIQIIPVGTTVWRFESNNLRICKVSGIRFEDYGNNEEHTYFTIVDIEANRDVSMSRNEFMDKCSLTKEECVERFLEKIGVKAKISIQFDDEQ